MKIAFVRSQINNAPALPMSSNELQEVVNSGLDVTVMDNATQTSLLDIKHDVDMVWFATHSSDAGIMLGDGPMDASAFSQIIRAKPNIRYVFLNTCSSISFATRLMDMARVSIIATISDIEDKEAFRTGAVFARHLASGADVWRAYELSKPGGNRIYVFLQYREDYGVDSYKSIDAKLSNMQNQIMIFEAKTTRYADDAVKRAMAKYRLTPRRRVARWVMAIIAASVYTSLIVAPSQLWLLSHPLFLFLIVVFSVMSITLIWWLAADEGDK